MSAQKAKGSAGVKVTCVQCGGNGYNIKQGWDGQKYPQECKGCAGTGLQTIRKADYGF